MTGVQTCALPIFPHLMSGVGLIYSGHEMGDPIAAVGSLGVLLGMLVLGWLVYRREDAKWTAARSTATTRQS